MQITLLKSKLDWLSNMK